MLAVALVKYTPEGVPNKAVIKATPSGNYLTGGDTLNLTPGTWSDPNGKGIIGYPSGPPSELPLLIGNVGMTESGNSANITGNIIPGTTLATYKLQIFVDGTEVSAGAYPAGLLTGYFEIAVPV